MIVKQQEEEIQALGKMIDEMTLGDKVNFKEVDKSNDLKK